MQVRLWNGLRGAAAAHPPWRCAQTVRALPVHDGTNKALREGFVSHKFDEKQRHPVAVIQENVRVSSDSSSCHAAAAAG